MTEMGVRVLLSREPGDPFGYSLQSLGIDVVYGKLTEILPIENQGIAAMGKALAAGSYAWLILTSGRTLPVIAAAGVDVIDAIDRGRRQGLQIAAVGKATAKSCRQLGITVDLLPPDTQANAEGLLSLFTSTTVERGCQYNSRILLPGSALSRPVLAEGLRKYGWTVEVVPVYTAQTCKRLPDTWRAALAQSSSPSPIFAVLTAGSVAEAGAELIGENLPPAIAIGQPSAEAARAAGWEVRAVAKSPTPADVAAAVHAARWGGKGNHPPAPGQRA